MTIDARSPIEKVLEVAGQVEARSDNDYMCVCPAHDDNNPSLHVTVDATGKLLLNCFKGCKTPAICYAWGLTVSELFPDHGQQRATSRPTAAAKRSNRPQGSKVAEFDYRDADGALVYQAVRYETEDGHKTFVQRRPNGVGGWIPNMRGVERVLYRLPELIASAADKTQPVYLVEGEKKVEALRKWGLVATCNVGGAGKWLAAYNAYLRGRRVIILPDNDPVDPVTGACPGRDHARKIIANLKGIAASVRVVDLPGLPIKGDIVDWQAAGGTLEQFTAVIDAPPVINLDVDDLFADPADKASSAARTAGESLLTPEQQTDISLSSRFAAQYANDLNFVPEWNSFIRWSGTHWHTDKVQQEVEFAKQFARSIWDEVEDHEPDDGDPNKTNPLEPLAKRVSSKKFVFDLISLIKSEPDIVTKSEFLDTQPGLLNVLNGTIDLQTGTLRKHQREDYITKICPLDYSPTAECPRWEQFVYQVMGEDLELTQFLQTWFGYCLTGDVREHKVPIFWGSGGNGKSVMLNTILKVVGDDYGYQAPPNLLIERNRDEHPTMLAALFGKRLVVCSETGDGARLNEALLKQLSGGDKVTARRLYQDFWEFEPSHKLVLLTNHKPSVRGTDPGMWRRLMLIPFVVKFWDEGKGETGPIELKQIKELPKMLLEESPGILNWLVAGARNWYENGLAEPLAAKAATAEYRTGEDVIQRFVDDKCLEGVVYKSRASDLYESYKKWAITNGEQVESQKKFGAVVSERYQRVRNNGFWYVGIGLKNDDTTENE